MIALDAMGGDYAPHVTIQGALKVAQDGIAVGLFGDQIRLSKELDASGIDWQSLPIFLFHCTQTIEMGAIPTRSVIRQQDSSLVQAMQAVVDGKATAVVTAGNSGAALVAGMFTLGRVPGVDRPALGRSLSMPQGSVFCLDLGANADCKPDYLAQFALMGQAYCATQLAITAPTIGLLSNGHEAYKGSMLVKQAYELLSKMPINFIGNIEARDVFDGQVDVIVCDGFTGNVFLKSVQGTLKTVTRWLEAEQSKSWLRQLMISFLGQRILTKLRATTEYADKEGALLLGLNHPLIISHGCSSANGIEASLRYAYRINKENVIPAFNEELMRLLPQIKKSEDVGIERAPVALHEPIDQQEHVE